MKSLIRGLASALWCSRPSGGLCRIVTLATTHSKDELSIVYNAASGSKLNYHDTLTSMCDHYFASINFLITAATMTL
jgi:outer membrane cobalamin receptor